MGRYDHTKFQHRVNSPGDFPDTPHLAIIEFGTIYIPGDERSRTNPGHGYPASSETTMTYTWFALQDREHWLYFIEDLMGIHQYSTRKDFIAIDQGIKVTPGLKLDIK